MGKTAKLKKGEKNRIGHPPIPVRKPIAQRALSCFFEEEEVSKLYHVFKTDFHEIRVNEKRMESFKKKLRRTTKKGPKYSLEGQHFMMTEFIMKRAKPRETKMSGEEWESSMKSLLYRIFEERWDRDFDDEGGEKGFSQSPVTTGASSIAEA